MPSEQWKNDLGSALLEYAQGTGQWDAVQKAFVDGWATEYAAANEQVVILENEQQKIMEKQ